MVDQVPVWNTDGAVERVGVVVPVHNEAATLARTLSGIRAAGLGVEVPVTVLVVLDDCSDGSEEICDALGVATLKMDRRNVGAARAQGCAALIDRQRPAVRQWVASTDGDSIVPAEWLAQQLALARSGADVVAGTVAVAWDGHTSLPHRREFERRYAARCDPAGHRHAHGANLGFRASSYLAVGGFQPLSTHEDRNLLDRFLTAPGVSVARVDSHPVLTSARRAGRAPFGFADDLRRLGQ